MAALEAVIHRLDIRRAQVLVEAIIVEMELIDGQDLGLQWLFAEDDGFTAVISMPMMPGRVTSPRPCCPQMTMSHPPMMISIWATWPVPWPDTRAVPGLGHPG